MSDPDKVRVSISYFNEAATVRLPFSRATTMEDVMYELDILDSSYIGGKTSIYRGLRAIRNDVFQERHGDRPDVPNYLILVTDGPPNMDVNGTITEAINNQIDGNHVILVLIGADLLKGRNYLSLYSIASEPYASNIIAAPDFKELLNKVPEVVNSLCNGKRFYDLTYKCVFNTLLERKDINLIVIEIIKTEGY